MVGECRHSWALIGTVVTDVYPDGGPDFEAVVQCRKWKEIEIGKMKIGCVKGPETAPASKERAG